MSIYIVGDLQGCLTPLQNLLHRLDFSWDRDQLWLTGDVVNRGNESLATLQFLQAHQDNIQMVLGNHDLHCLAVGFGVSHERKGDTLRDILESPQRFALLDWLRQQPMLHYDAKRQALLVHAGLPAIWTLTAAQTYAKEVEKILQSDHLPDFLAALYGDAPDLWDNDLRDFARHRCQTSYFTRMRFSSAEGRLEFRHKGKPDTAPPGFAPWFTFASIEKNPPQLFFGHWASLGFYRHANATCLDSGCIWGGVLTALNLDDPEEVIQVRC